ncbi:hypothetical protein LTR36_002704 [Oleoguttula mirabilis]|uniref:Uncharacterized protein n=1 Tax=Oleoguttula mirabilis TaxID=1507867 RepID=A0AAV9JKH4_9PEZI|nr:hypothetical protein LTR36_002704 [Oleoguttula mirabilis]
MLVPVLPGWGTDAHLWNQIHSYRTIAAKQASISLAQAGKPPLKDSAVLPSGEIALLQTEENHFPSPKRGMLSTREGQVTNLRPPFETIPSSSSGQVGTSITNEATFAAAAAHVKKGKGSRDAEIDTIQMSAADGHEETQQKAVEDNARAAEDAEGDGTGEGEEAGDGEEDEDGDGGEDGNEDEESAPDPANFEQKGLELLEMVHFNHVHRSGTELHWEIDNEDFIGRDAPIYKRGGSVQRVLIGDHQTMDVMICDSDCCGACGGDKGLATESATHRFPSVHSVDLQRKDKHMPFMFAPTPQALFGSIEKYSSLTGRSVTFQHDRPVTCRALVCDFRECSVCQGEVRRVDEDQDELG